MRKDAQRALVLDDEDQKKFDDCVKALIAASPVESRWHWGDVRSAGEFHARGAGGV